MKQVTVVLPRLHKLQRTIADDPARFKVAVCGRRFGKTAVGSLLCLAEGILGHRAWWVAPTYAIAGIGWSSIKTLADQIPGTVIKNFDKSVTFPNGGSVAVKSAIKPDNLRGAGLDFVVLDEAAYITGRVWYEVLRPALSDRMGRALFISTPNGLNWFYDIYNKRDDSEWSGFRFPTSANPLIPQSEIDAAKEDIPEIVFQQEYEAEFVSDASTFFRNVNDRANAIYQSIGKSSHKYSIGIDWGKINDFTVVTVYDINTDEAVFMERFNQIGYNIQKLKVLSVVEKFPDSLLTIELNSIGQAMYDYLSELVLANGKRLSIRGVTLGNANKRELMEDLALAFEQNKISILSDPVLIRELTAFRLGRTSTGKFSFSSPDGTHDDTVVSLALALNGSKHFATWRSVRI